MTVLGEDRFRMKLYPVYFFSLYLKRHYLFVIGTIGCRFYPVCQTIFVDNQRMISGGGKLFWDVFKYRGLGANLHRRSFTVHHIFCPLNLCPKSLSDGLMSETNTEYWDFSSEFFDNLQNDLLETILVILFLNF